MRHQVVNRHGCFLSHSIAVQAGRTVPRCPPMPRTNGSVHSQLESQVYQGVQTKPPSASPTPVLEETCRKQSRATKHSNLGVVCVCVSCLSVFVCLCLCVCVCVCVCYMLVTNLSINSKERNTQARGFPARGFAAEQQRTDGLACTTFSGFFRKVPLSWR